MNEATRIASDLFTRGRYEEAAEICRQALSADPGQLDLMNLLALSEAHLGNFDAAEASLHRALEVAPDIPEVHANLQTSLGYVALQRGDPGTAETAFQAAIDHFPGHVNANYNLGCALQESDPWRAEAAYRAVLTAKPDHCSALNNLGSLLLDQDDLEGATNLYRQAVTANPNDSLSHRNLGKALRYAGSVESAITHFERAAALAPNDPEVQFGRALTLLTAGNYGRGWEAYRWRYRVEGNPPRHTDLPEWAGQALRGQTLLVHTEQGFGDSLQFARFLPMAAARGARVVLECPAPLSRLFSGIDGVAEVLVRGNTPPKVDFQIPLLELPRLFQINLEDLASTPYLTAREVSGLLPALSQNNGRARIGIVFGTRSRTPGSSRKSLHVNAIDEVMNTERPDFFILQKDATDEELAHYRRAGATDVTSSIRDFADTAAMIAQMDLIISVDTAVAHLAGALGKPVWVLLHAYPDWRWLVGRDDSPWYPTARLFRQPTPGDWRGVGKRVRSELEKYKR